ncbi:UPF0149 family protein [Pistricoccus aurantiacus]|uniref:UPF0149 family protein n=1 Tax=Pistricoccus aurantiacus TaxID=1883414 RepID=A0A5B8SUD6_9GAMM|nr:UPF0149 family protein [Pistricoccus aurantiacus]QEA38390.1 UPF0149 family protein [Pistricoccus aurantiacus]
MSLINERIDFATIADTFLVHGSFQSPAFLDGHLAAALGLIDIDATGWLEEVCAALGVEQPRDPQSAETLLQWRQQSLAALSAAELDYEPLLPDEMFSLAERAEGLRQWCMGFLEDVNNTETEVQERWSQELREAIGDLAALAELEIDLEDSSENENDLFALTEHARMAAMLLYTEQHPGMPQVEKPQQTH